jgi:predicted NodU family carbamoyl transferase
MAPVMLKKNDTFFFDSKEVARVVGSDRYMILTYVYKNELNREVYGGVMHKVQGENFDTEIQYSGRPQFLYQRDDNQVVFDLLQNLDQKNDVKALINTSYNVHGTPIVYDAKDAVDNFVYQVVMKVYKNIDKELYLYVGL